MKPFYSGFQQTYDSICVFKMVRKATMAFIGKKNQLVLVSLCYSLLSVCLLSEAKNSISKGQQLKDGEFLTSVDDVFELGFFSIANSSTSRYLGIRYSSIQDKAIIWIANINNPISGRNGSLTIGENGNLLLRDGNGTGVWFSALDIDTVNTVAVLLPTGNFILSNNGSSDDVKKAYWQSFKDPTDTWLGGMSVLVQGEIRPFSSWSSETDPFSGNFTMGVDSRGAPQIVIWEDSRRIWRSGHWTGLTFTGYQVKFLVETYVDGQDYLSYYSPNSSDLSRFQISWDGYLDQSRWNESENKWSLIQRQPANECDHYNYCGNFAVCNNSNNPKCACIDGFRPGKLDQWNRGNRSDGCWRITAFQCQNTHSSTEKKEDDFKVLRNVKLPDFADNVRTAVTLEECKAKCLETCSCNAYSYIGGIGCMSWSGDLIDVQYSYKSEFHLWVRVGASETGGSNLSNRRGGGSRLSSPMIVIIVLACGSFAIALGWLLRKLKYKSEESELPLFDADQGKLYPFDQSGQTDFTIDSSQVNAPDLPIFNFNIVAAATDNFSEENRLGQGGFGPVYKGKLPGGEKIAVKRLSKVSGQGLEEFKNEVMLIAKLQHRNLVRLLGCCIQGEEKILLYEFMPNKSLDCFIFDPAMQSMLDWRKRFLIIEGIARGLLYLHRDSRLRIIHRDLKASNILLDEDMNPKISDFGMAKMFGGNQSEANTNRVVGTFGYMSPEYVMEGIFSVKSDVYSFGVLLLEIVSGRRNTSFRLSDHPNLIAYSWQVWSEGRAMELVDSSIRNSSSEEEVLKCIQVGILCVQDFADRRPTMQTVVSMLESNSSALPWPKQPTFTLARTSSNSEIHSQIVSSNDMSVTSVFGR